MLTAIETELQENSVLRPHGRCTSSTQVWRQGRQCHWTLQDTYYIRPHCPDTESKQLHLTLRNKHRKTAKMRRQRNMAQMKQHTKTPEKELNKIEISNLSEAEFKILVRSRPKEYSGHFNSVGGLRPQGAPGCPWLPQMRISLSPKSSLRAPS